MSRLESLRRALSSPSPIVKYNARTKCFVHPETGSRYRGITDITKRIAPSGSGRGGMREIVAGPKGRKRGTLVDTQAARVFNGNGGSGKDSQLHPYTLKFLSALKKEGLRRVRAQVAVADIERRVATAVDFVTYKPDADAVVLIELKCGFESTDPVWLAKQERCHALQLAVTKRLFSLTYPGISRIRALVFRVHSAGVRVHGISDECKSMVDTALDQVQLRAPKRHKKSKSRRVRVGKARTGSTATTTASSGDGGRRRLGSSRPHKAVVSGKGKKTENGGRTRTTGPGGSKKVGQKGKGATKIRARSGTTKITKRAEKGGVECPKRKRKQSATGGGRDGEATDAPGKRRRCAE